MSRERVLITCDACGIGRASAERYRADGYDVVMTDREEEGIPANLFDPTAAARALDEAVRNGPVTCLVDNVGTVRPGSVGERSVADLEAMVSLNLRRAASSVAKCSMCAAA